MFRFNTTQIISGIFPFISLLTATCFVQARIFSITTVSIAIGGCCWPPYPSTFCALRIGLCPDRLTSMMAPLLELNQWGALQDGGRYQERGLVPMLLALLAFLQGLSFSREVFPPSQISPPSTDIGASCPFLPWGGNRFSLLWFPGCFTFIVWLLTSAHTSAKTPSLRCLS